MATAPPGGLLILITAKHLIFGCGNRVTSAAAADGRSGQWMEVCKGEDELSWRRARQLLPILLAY